MLQRSASVLGQYDLKENLFQLKIFRLNLGSISHKFAQSFDSVSFLTDNVHNEIDFLVDGLIFFSFHLGALALVFRDVPSSIFRFDQLEGWFESLLAWHEVVEFLS